MADRPAVGERETASAPEPHGEPEPASPSGSPVRRVLARVVAAIVARAALAYLLVVAATERPRSAMRRRRAERPRLIWGPVPIISLKYWSAAMRRAGYESRTCVLLHYAAHRREDFDLYLDEFAGEGFLSQVIAPYRFLAWALRRGDVFLRFLDGGFLRYTPHQRWDPRLLRLAGKRLIVSPYGADIAVAGHLEGLEAELYADYPYLADASDEIERRVRHTAKWADLVVRNWQIGFLPRHDAVWLSMLAIDLDHWRASGQGSDADGRDGEVTVLHAPNHRHIKGTEHLERAVRDLREEGLRIRLELIEGRSNEEVRRAMMETDVVADQFLLPGYAMAALEAMAEGKPVMVNLSGLPEELKATEAFRACPAVDTNPERLKEDLRRLVTDPELRGELGRAGREFVERFHSYPVVAETWGKILEHVWRGAPLPERLLPRAEPGVGASRASAPAR
jgi:glycosyltransferase involved in cell wall biosynthesis